MTVPNTFDTPEIFDYFVLAGGKSPGQLLSFGGLAEKQKWEKKEGDGEEGGSTTHKGGAINAFSATIELVRTPEVDQWSDWEAFLPVLRSSYATKAQGLDIYHPDLAELGITSVSVEEIGGKVHVAPGVCTVTIKFIEFKPPKPKSSTAGGSKSGGAGNPSDPYDSSGQDDDPNADAKKQLDALLEEASKP